jgi:hypothetical protein
MSSSRQFAVSALPLSINASAEANVHVSIPWRSYDRHDHSLSQIIGKRLTHHMLASNSAAS